MRTAILLTMACVLALTSPAFADNSNALTKLGRGLGNIASCWLELPVQVGKKTQDEGVISGLSVGIVKGLAFTVGRLAAGIYETLTFPIPWPDGYRSVIDPEFVISQRDGPYYGM